MMISNGETDPLVPVELGILLEPFRNEADRNAVRKAYYGLAEGDPRTFSVQFSVLLTACTAAMKATPEAHRRVIAEENKAFAIIVDEAKTSIQQSAREMKESRIAAQKDIADLRTKMSDIQAAADKAKDIVEKLSRLRTDLIGWAIVGTLIVGGLTTVLILEIFGRIH